jgi:hypothetical protein
LEIRHYAVAASSSSCGVGEVEDAGSFHAIEPAHLPTTATQELTRPPARFRFERRLHEEVAARRGLRGQGRFVLGFKSSVSQARTSRSFFVIE